MSVADCEIEEPSRGPSWCDVHEQWYSRRCMACRDEAADRAHDSLKED